jgi:enolase-phosphatase E1
VLRAEVFPADGRTNACDDVNIALAGKGVEAIVLDIEGTTTPIAFVYDVLFPFARAHLREFLQNPMNADAVREPLQRLHEEWLVDPDRGTAVPDGGRTSGDGSELAGGDGGQLEWAASYVEWLMDRDRKSPALKLLQGLIWEGGYRAGALKGEVFADVPPALQRWRGAGLEVAIYSSGSELAQRLIFGNTAYGDLTRFISRFFDTAVGAKGEPASYRRIAADLGRAPDRLVFISDVTAELDAAVSAGCEVILCVRPGNRSQPEHAYTEISSFEEIT